MQIYAALLSKIMKRMLYQTLLRPQQFVGDAGGVALQAEALVHWGRRKGSDSPTP